MRNNVMYRICARLHDIIEVLASAKYRNSSSIPTTLKGEWDILATRLLAWVDEGVR